MAGVFGAIALVIMEGTGVISSGWETRIQGMTIATFSLSLFGVFSYHFFCEGIHGSTLGKMICRIRVISMDGRPNTIKGALIRGLAWYLDSLFFGLVGYSSMEKSTLNQRLGDVWGKTIVVKSRQAPDTSRRSLGWFFLALFLGSNCWLITLVLGMIFKAMK
jgi:uncharacterized RDD family membrane protein YckC